MALVPEWFRLSTFDASVIVSRHLPMACGFTDQFVITVQALLPLLVW